MPFEMTWLELRTNAPGLPGPILEDCGVPPGENGAPRLVMAVGSAVKDRHLERSFPHASAAKEAVCLRRYDEMNYIADCSLHVGGIPERVDGGPTIGDKRRYYLEGFSRSGNSRTAIAYQLYMRVLYLFSTVVLFFADDFSGVEDASGVLARWIAILETNRVRQGHPPPRLIVVASSNQRSFLQTLSQKLLQEVCPMQPNSTRALRTWFDEVSLVHPSEMTDLSSVIASSNCISRLREQKGYSLSRSQFQQVFRLALVTFSGNTQFDFVNACRSLYPLPPRMGSHLTRLLQGGYPGATKRIAASLALDPLARCLPPDLVFETIRDQLQGLQRDSLISIEQTFYRILAQIDIATDRRFIVDKAMQSLPQKALGAACASCLIRAGGHRLPCSHQLCDNCAPACGELSGLECSVQQCPMCGSPGRATFRLKPHAASVRALILPGERGHEATARLLRELQRNLFGPLCDYIDIIIAAGSAILPVLDMITNGITTRDSVEGMWSDSPAEETSIAGKVRQRVHLERAAKALTRSEHACRAVLLRRQKVITNYSQSIRKVSKGEGILRLAETECSDLWPEGRLFQVVQDGNEGLEKTVRSLIASSFYLDRCSFVDSRAFPKRCTISIRCRVPAGRHLANLINNLRELKTFIYYRADQVAWSRAPLCDQLTWDEVKRGHEFCIAVDTEARSSGAELQLELGGRSGGAYCIGSYVLSEVVQVETSPRSSRSTTENKVEEQQVESKTRLATEAGGERADEDKTVLEEMEKLNALLENAIARTGPRWTEHITG